MQKRHTCRCILQFVFKRVVLTPDCPSACLGQKWDLIQVLKLVTIVEYTPEVQVLKCNIHENKMSIDILGGYILNFQPKISTIVDKNKTG